MSIKNIAEYMNSRSTTRQFTRYDVSAIQYAIRKELDRRKAEGLEINGKTREGKLQINRRVAIIANEKMQPKVPFTPEDIRLYKISWAQEFADRTGRCAWGFPGTRQKLGYDPVTGRELAG